MAAFKMIGNLSSQVVGNPYVRMRGIDLVDVAVASSSFRFDPPGSPLRSTQQIPLDWDVFENHTFFGSAEASVNVAFDTIINNFPFDGSSAEINYFLDSLTGFERRVYDRFPKSINSLAFSGSSSLSVNDIAGGLFPNLSKINDGSAVLDPGHGSISFQFKMFAPNESNNNSCILQRLSGSSGYSLFLSQSSSLTSANLNFFTTSGSATLDVTASIPKNTWVDVCAQFNRKPGANRLFLYVDGKLINSSSTSYEFSSFDTSGVLLNVGTGSKHEGTGFSFLPTNNFSGSLDEFKVFHKARTSTEIESLLSASASPSDELKLYYKFNEPSGSYAQSSLVIDSSGNGLHTTISSFSAALKSTPNGRPAMIERSLENPVLFPDFPTIVSLNTELLTSGSLYDDTNPNLITKLVPKQYFVLGQLAEGFEEEQGPLLDSYPYEGTVPRDTKIGPGQILSSLLYIWAKQFDENKIFLDHFSKFENLSYTATGSIASQFLPLQARNYGFELPRLFTPTDLKSSIYGDDVGIDPGEGTQTLAEVQSQIWRRMLAGLPEIIRSKGTVHSVKSIIRAFGVNPDTSIRVREYGGARGGFISGRRSRRDSTGKLAVTGSWVATSPYLSGSRTEPGLPTPSGSLSSVGSTASSDGLFTSGSWTWEGVFRYPESRSHGSTESLVRFYTTGSSGKALTLNVVATPNGLYSDDLTTVNLYGAYSNSTTNAFNITLTGSHLLNGDRWLLSLGREKESSTHSRWFLRLGSSNSGEIFANHMTGAYVTSSAVSDIFSNIGPTLGASGSFFIIGNEANVSTSSPLLTTANYPAAITGSFTGEISNVRFFSKYTDDVEWLEHIRNHESLGVRDPSANFNFVTTESGSFQRLRIDVPFDQDNLTSDGSGNITFYDFSQNNLHLAGSAFQANTTVIDYDDVIFSSLEPKFDERSADNKIRVRSWNSYENVQLHGGEVGPVYQVPVNEEGNDDMRFGIEISTVKGLDEDMIKMFSDYQSLDNIIGNPANLFDETYPELDDIRDIYFNRLTGKIDIRNIFLFSKWFEENIGKLIEQVLPANTRFFGTNFVVESHMLERHKARYHWGDIYLGENDRRGLRGTIGLSQLLATIKRA